jgi:hypothetical protein
VVLTAIYRQGLDGPFSNKVAGFGGPGVAGIKWSFLLFCGWFSWPSTVERKKAIILSYTF